MTADTATGLELGGAGSLVALVVLAWCVVNLVRYITHGPPPTRLGRSRGRKSEPGTQVTDEPAEPP